MKKDKIDIGQKVFVINKDCSIEEKKVLAVINTEKKKGYTLDDNICGGYSEEDVFISEEKAEVALQNFKNSLKFMVGDLVIFEYKDYQSKKKAIGRIVKIRFFGKPYEVRGSCEEFDGITESQILLKVKNEFIENYGNIKRLYKEFEEKEKEIMKIIDSIDEQFLLLETEINDSVRKNYSILNWNRKKPLFKDRFDYVRESDW